MGDHVSKGQHIAGIGGTGEVPVVHLHYQVVDGPSLVSSRTLPVVFSSARVNSLFAHEYRPELMFQPGVFMLVDQDQ